MKKLSLICALLLSLIVFVFSGCSSQPPQPDVSMSFEEAIKISKQGLIKYFDSPVNEDDYTLKIQRSNSNTVSVSWNSKDGNINAYTNIDLTSRDIIQSSIYDYSNENSTDFSDTTKDDVLDISYVFLSMNFPEKKDLVRENETSYFEDPASPYASVFLYRTENDIEFPENMISVGIDKNTQKVNSFSIVWDDDLVFPFPENIPSEEESMNIFKQNYDMNLAYVLSSKSPNRPILAYLNDYSVGSILNCSSKELVHPNYSYKPFSGKEEKIGEIIDSNIGSFYETLANLDYSSKSDFISSEFLSEDFEFNKSNFSQNITGYDGLYFEYFDPRGYSANVYLDEETSEIISLYIPTRKRVHKDFSPKLEWEDGYYEAISLIASLYPDKVYDLEFVSYPYDFRNYDDNSDFEPIYYYTFNRNIDGIPFLYNNISVGINASTGRVSSINLSWSDDLDFDATKKIIDKRLALDKYFSNKEIRLSYFTIDGQNNEKKVILGYMLYSKDMNSIDIDAVTGEFIKY